MRARQDNRTGPRASWTAVVLALLLPAQRLAAYAGGEEQARDIARAKLSEGATLLQARDYVNALAAFEQAHAIFPSPKIFYNVGLANEGLKRWGAAFRAFERFLRLAQDANPEHVAHSRERLEHLSSRVAFVTLSCNVADADVRLDGEFVGRTPLPARVAVDTGPHDVVVRRPDRGSDTKRFTVIAGQAIDVRVELGESTGVRPISIPGSALSHSKGAAGARPSALSAEGGSLETRFHWSKWRITGAALAGVGVASAVTGLVLVLNATQSCEEARKQELGCVNLAKEQLPGKVLIGVGGAALVGGVAFWIVDWRFRVVAGPSSVAVTFGGSL